MLTWVNSAAVLSEGKLARGQKFSLWSIRTLEKRYHRNDTRRRDVDGKLILPNGELLYVFGQAAHQPCAVSMHIVGLALVFIGRVDKRGLELANVISRCLSHVLRILGHHDQVWCGGGKGANELGIAALYRLLRWPQS